MKKCIIFFLLLLYCASNIGIRAQVHYCMGHLVALEIYKEVENEAVRCENCGMEESDDNGCCKHVDKQLKIEENQLCNESIDCPYTPVYAILPHLSFPSLWTNDYADTQCITYATPPLPPDKGIPLYLAYRTFLI